MGTMRNEEIELILLRSIVERGENCKQAAEHISRFFYSVTAPDVKEADVVEAGHADQAKRIDLHNLILENEKLRLENWQLKGALGYPVPGHIPEGDFKCGLCDARRVSEKRTKD